MGKSARTKHPYEVKHRQRQEGGRKGGGQIAAKGCEPLFDFEGAVQAEDLGQDGGGIWKNCGGDCGHLNEP